MILSEFFSGVSLVYSVHSLYLIREDILLEKTLKCIEPFTSSAEKNSRFCIACGEPATMLVKYDTKGAIIIEKYCDRCARQIEESSAK